MHDGTIHVGMCFDGRELFQIALCKLNQLLSENIHATSLHSSAYSLLLCPESSAEVRMKRVRHKRERANLWGEPDDRQARR